MPDTNWVSPMTGEQLAEHDRVIWNSAIDAAAEKVRQATENWKGPYGKDDRKAMEGIFKAAALYAVRGVESLHVPQQHPCPCCGYIHTGVKNATG